MAFAFRAAALRTTGRPGAAAVRGLPAAVSGIGALRRRRGGRHAMSRLKSLNARREEPHGRLQRNSPRTRQPTAGSGRKPHLHERSTGASRGARLLQGSPRGSFGARGRKPRPGPRADDWLHRVRNSNVNRMRSAVRSRPSFALIALQEFAIVLQVTPSVWAMAAKLLPSVLQIIGVYLRASVPASQREFRYFVCSQRSVLHRLIGSA